MLGKQTINILVLEDDDLDFQILARRLCARESRYRLSHARTLEEARLLIGERPIDAGLFDYRLAGDRNGLDFVKELGGRQAPFPIILITGVEDDKIDRDAILSGAYDYLDKFALTAESIDRAIRFAMSTRSHEARLCEAIKQANEQAAINRRILAIVGHEMHSPLRSIIGYCDHMMEDCETAAGRESASRMKTAATHLEDFLGNLSEYVRLDNGSAKLIEKPFDLAEMVRETAAFFEPYAAHKSIQFQLEIDAANAYVIADRLRLRQILINLLRNAITHTDEGSIKISASVVKDILSIEVRDDGVGMSEEKISSILADRLGHDVLGGGPGGGLGIGLSICQRLLRLMGGRLSIESAPGLGTSAGFVVPIRKSHPARAA